VAFVTSLDLRAMARALDGEVAGRQVLAPGPGHGPRDRSLSVRPSTSALGGFVVHSYADDPFDLCRDHVAGRIGLDLNAWRLQGRGVARPAPTFAPREPRPEPDRAGKVARAAALWAEAMPPQGTVVERYLASRGLELPPGADAIRFHPGCPWREDNGTIVRVPAMLAAMRAVDGDTITGIHRTQLTPEGTKVDRRMLGAAAGAAIKLDADPEVTLGLAVGEGIESVLAARQLGIRPAWALTSAGAMATLPVLPGIEALTHLAENDSASARAVEACASRWHGAGREVIVIEPMTGSDLNDALMSRRAA